MQQSTHAAELARTYLELGGTRKASLDDNQVSTRKWDGEPAEAKQFWDEHIATLDTDRRAEVETLLPSINTE
jgi:hypothetical protein